MKKLHLCRYFHTLVEINETNILCIGRYGKSSETDIIRGFGVV